MLQGLQYRSNTLELLSVVRHAGSEQLFPGISWYPGGISSDCIVSLDYSAVCFGNSNLVCTLIESTKKFMQLAHGQLEQ